jgi:hypothetical protein
MNQALNYQWKLLALAMNCDSLTHTLTHSHTQAQTKHAACKGKIYLPKLSTQNFLRIVNLVESEIILSDKYYGTWAWSLVDVEPKVGEVGTDILTVLALCVEGGPLSQI